MINENAINEMQTSGNLQKIALQPNSKMKIEYSGDVYLVAESELMKMENSIKKIPTLEAGIVSLKKEIDGYKSKFKKAKRLYDEECEKTTKLQQEVVKRDSLIEEQRQKITQLENALHTLNNEYAKLKAFKDNQGRGRQTALNPQQVAEVRALALQGRTTAEIHRLAQSSGVNVSRETIRKIVNQVRGIEGGS